LDDAIRLFAVDVQFNFEDVWVEDELVELNFREAEVDLLGTAVQDTGNPVVSSQCVGIFFPYAPSQGAAQ
jgi:hypothetical protein